ncbi:tannase and feruloyl esterase [Dendrothele bispora CBS 962.96]|uniref:Carboxylic ester hydrolase n=1 Tax=Dendrothele bispora (strain CBS 962.96) TaxID=1314807 RepID=A0A4S8LT66_DENBC|nr:tannase and feruloyl esterase [Dendrothele bispora CBS 962.96]
MLPSLFRNLGYGGLFDATFLSGVAGVQVPQCLSRRDECYNLKNKLHLENTTIISATYVEPNSTVNTAGSCQSNATVTSSICRVYASVNTSSISSTKFELWLPDKWYGRFLTVGNGGFAGCIDYMNTDYGATEHFATVGSDGGHDGVDSSAFFNNSEVLVDFSWRAVHVSAVLGKQIVAEYYSSPVSYSYYLGCSTGGRQAYMAATRFPEDFDGIVGGSPAVNNWILASWQGIASKWIGAPDLSSPKHISAPQWDTIHAEILAQCDGLDGILDGIITEPDNCRLDFTSLACQDALNSTSCLTKEQLDVLNNIFNPLIGIKGELLWPRLDPGFEANDGWTALLSGSFAFFAEGFFRDVVYTDKFHNFDNFSLPDLYFSSFLDAADISTWSPDLSTFRANGGKYLTYHGHADSLIPAGISKITYDRVATNLSLSSLDDFYRLFLISGMGHCTGGGDTTAYLIGNAGLSTIGVNDTEHSVLLAIVHWVESGVAPEVILGTTPNGTERAHCRYGQRSALVDNIWVCM